MFYENFLKTNIPAAVFNPEISLEFFHLGLILLHIIYSAVLEYILLMLIVSKLGNNFQQMSGAIDLCLGTHKSCLLTSCLQHSCDQSSTLYWLLFIFKNHLMHRG